MDNLKEIQLRLKQKLSQKATSVGSPPPRIGGKPALVAEQIKLKHILSNGADKVVRRPLMKLVTADKTKVIYKEGADYVISNDMNGGKFFFEHMMLLVKTGYFLPDDFISP